MQEIKKTINGVEYTAVWNGILQSEKMMKECTVNGNLSVYRLAEKVFSQVIINPKISIDDFADRSSFYDVLDFGVSVLQGDFGEKKSKGALKKDVMNHWGAWRLIYCDMANFDYNTVFNEMTPQEIEKANIALDIVNEQINKQMKRKR